MLNTTAGNTETGETPPGKAEPDHIKSNPQSVPERMAGSPLVYYTLIGSGSVGTVAIILIVIGILTAYPNTDMDRTRHARNRDGHLDDPIRRPHHVDHPEGQPFNPALAENEKESPARVRRKEPVEE